MLCRALSSNEPFSHRGRFWQFDDIVVEPAPYQRPHPPVWLAASLKCKTRLRFALVAATTCCWISSLRPSKSVNASGSTGRNWRRPVTPMIRCGLRSRATAGSRFSMRPTAYEAIGRQAQVHERLLALSRGSESRAASHILAYSDTAGAGGRAHSLIGSSAEIAAKLTVLKACRAWPMCCCSARVRARTCGGSPRRSCRASLPSERHAGNGLWRRKAGAC